MSIRATTTSSYDGRPSVSSGTYSLPPKLRALCAGLAADAAVAAGDGGQAYRRLADEVYHVPASIDRGTRAGIAPDGHAYGLDYAVRLWLRAAAR